MKERTENFLKDFSLYLAGGFGVVGAVEVVTGHYLSASVALILGFLLIGYGKR